MIEIEPVNRGVYLIRELETYLLLRRQPRRNPLLQFRFPHEAKRVEGSVLNIRLKEKEGILTCRNRVGHHLRLTRETGFPHAWPRDLPTRGHSPT